MRRFAARTLLQNVGRAVALSRQQRTNRETTKKNILLAVVRSALINVPPNKEYFRTVHGYAKKVILAKGY